MMREGVAKQLAIISESDGDYWMNRFDAGEPEAYFKAVDFYRRALRFDKENIGLLSKYREAELAPYVAEFWRWMDEEMANG